jgi:hypothetical protein
MARNALHVMHLEYARKTSANSLLAVALVTLLFWFADWVLGALFSIKDPT